MRNAGQRFFFFCRCFSAETEAFSLVAIVFVLSAICYNNAFPRYKDASLAFCFALGFLCLVFLSDRLVDVRSSLRMSGFSWSYALLLYVSNFPRSVPLCFLLSGYSRTLIHVYADGNGKRDYDRARCPLAKRGGRAEPHSTSPWRSRLLRD